MVPMSAQYLHQVIFCSGRKGRAFRREVAVSSNSALITAVEKLPPGYELALEKMQNPGELVAYLRGKVKYVDGCGHCPFCGNGSVFICDCGRMSCIAKDQRSHHCCPSCDRIQTVQDAVGSYVSESGLIGNAQERMPEPENTYGARANPYASAYPAKYPPLRELPGPDTGKRKEVEEKRSKLQRFLEDKRKKD